MDNKKLFKFLYKDIAEIEELFAEKGAEGFDQYEIINIINGFINTQKVVAVEFVEVNPLLDFKGNKMAETAFEVLDAVTKTIKENI